MENVILIIHLILSLSLIGIVLLQRSEGGGLGIGGGGGGGGVSTRGTATAMGKITWFLAVCFIITSVTLTILAAQKAASGSVIGDGTETSSPADPLGNLALPNIDNLMPPTAEEPVAPPRAD